MSFLRDIVKEIHAETDDSFAQVLLCTPGIDFGVLLSPKEDHLQHTE